MKAPAPRYTSNGGVIEAASAVLGDLLIEHYDRVGEVCLTVARDGVVTALTALRDTPGLEYQQLMEIAGVDWPERPERFDVVYCLLSLTRNHRIRVKVTTDEEAPVPSVTGLWPVAGWLEREVYDMYGVLFDGNPDLRRILTDYGFRGHPFRKDFPLSGFSEMRYSEEHKRVVYEPVKLSQDFRSFDFISPWEGAEYVLPGDEKGTQGEAKGAPTPAPAGEVKKSDAAPAPTAKPDAAPGTGYGRSTDTRKETGVGAADAGNKPEDKPLDPAVIPSKGKGQNL